MKKTTLVSSLVLSGIVLAAFGGTTASAAPVGSSMDTTTKIEFSGHTPNPDPDGDLDLIWVPATFDFGTHDTSTNAAQSTYNMVNDLPKYVVVQDNRTTNGVTATDWEVNAVASELTSGSNSLGSAATLNFGDITPKQYAPVGNDITIAPETTGVIVNAPTGFALQGASAQSLATDGTTSITLMHTTSGGAVASDKYAGEINSLSLTIPAATAMQGSYSGTVTWTLNDGI